MGASLTKWFIFSVIVSLLPIVFAFAYKVTFDSDASSDLPLVEKTVVHGELLLISVALAADALGEIITSGSQKKFLKYLAGGGCVICIICASLYFAVVSVKDPARVGLVFWISVAVFVLTLLSAGTCKALAELDQ